MYVASTDWVERSLMINVYTSKGNCFVLPFFECNFIPMLRFRFVVLAGKAIGCQGTYPIKHSGPLLNVESFGIGIGFSSSHVSTHFIVVAQLEAFEDQR